MLSIKERLKTMKVSKKKLGLAAALVILCTVVAVLKLSGPESKNTGADFSLATVQRGSIQQTVEGTGTLQPRERFVLRSKTSGTVKEVMVSEGTQVDKGDPILTIDNEKINTQSRQAAISWELAQKELEELLSPTSASDSKRIAAELKVEQYEIALQEAREQKDKLTLKAPFNGTVLKNELYAGQKVTAGTKALTVATTDEVEAVARFSDRDLSSLSAGMKADVYVKGLNKTYHGRVKEIAFSGDAATGTFEVLISLDNPDQGIRPGMLTYNTVFVVNDPDNELFIYKQAEGHIRYTEEEDMTTEVSGTVEEIFVEPGAKIYKDEPILRLSNPELDRRLRETELQLANAREELRQITDPDEKTVKQQELKMLQSYDSYLSAREKADSLSVTSPIDGVVVKLSVSPGEELSSENLEQELVVISSFQQTELKISVDELDINKLKMGQEAIVTADALPNVQLKGKIAGIAYEGTTTNNITKYDVTLAVDYTEGIKGGMSATATILLDKKDNILCVPAEAVTTVGGRSIVTAMVDGQPQVKQIETGLSTDRWVEVVNGLQEGEQIVVASSSGSGGQVQMFGPGMGGPPPGGGGGTVRIQRGPQGR